MKKKFNLLLSFLSVFAFTGYVNGQGAILNHGHLNEGQPGCGSYELMNKIDQSESNYMELSNNLMENLGHLIEVQKENRAYVDLYVVPVVFHIIHSETEEDIPDSVIFNQLEILNDCFRRHNADTSETRPEFLDLVGDTKIEFQLATEDPLGNPTTGITRTETDITHFGGVLPYGPGETEDILNWVNDSLYYNLFRLTESSLGGENAWDTDYYLNVWIGDLRILEPEFDDFEELIFFALATPPADHANWPEELLNGIDEFEQGVLMHYVNVGSNNPNTFPVPYNGYNGVVTTGKVLVHEVGHYLGLRHIWGDGNCTMDDYIADTPNSTTSSSWTCNHSANYCTDDIGGENLPNMVENYMDYSSGDCQNSFTIGQADLMRSVLEEYRPLLSEVVSTAGLAQEITAGSIIIYPNPAKENLTIDFGENREDVRFNLINNLGQRVFSENRQNAQLVTLDLNIAPGIYVLQVDFGSAGYSTHKIVIE